MKLFGLEILNKNSANDIRKRLNNIQEAYYANRPQAEVYDINNVDGVTIPYLPVPYRDLKDLALYSDVIRIALINLRGETFRNGIIAEQNSNRQNSQNNDGKQILESEKDLFELFRDNANKNGQTMSEVLGMLEDDVNIFDDGYLFFNRDYAYANKKIVQEKLKELLRIDPAYTRIIADNTGMPGMNNQGERLYVCPSHRDSIQKTEICDTCGCETLVAGYAFTVTKDAEKYYGVNEVVHVSKYSPGLLYGFSPVLSVWQKAITLMNQDKYIREYYGKQRPPKGALFVNTRNQTSLQKSWDWLLQKTRKNPHVIHPLGVETNGNGNVAQFVDFMNSLNEMQFKEGREEMRRIIGAIYGVSPLFQNDVSTSGGLNNEGLQITVTNRAVERSKAVYNQKILPAIKKELGISSFDIVLPPSDEEDETAKIDRYTKQLDNAKRLVSMGVPIQFDGEGNYNISSDFDGKITQEDLLEASSGFETASGDSGLTMDNPLTKSYEFKKEGRSTTLSQKYEDIVEDNLGDIDNESQLEDKSITLLVGAIASNLVGDLKEANSEIFKKIYKNELEQVSDENNIDVGFESDDENVLEDIMQSGVLQSSYKDLGDELTQQLNTSLRDTISKHGYDMNKIKQTVKEVTDVTTSRANTIARTESNKISNAARQKAYEKIDPNDEGKYDWIGPNDNRTTDLSQRIKNRVGNGVSRQELIRILEEESGKDFPEWVVNPVAPASHYNSRHVMRYKGGGN